MEERTAERVVRQFGQPLRVYIGGYHVPMPTREQLDAARLQDNEQVYAAQRIQAEGEKG